jgi:hypothetical protein
MVGSGVGVGDAGEGVISAAGVGVAEPVCGAGVVGVGRSLASLIVVGSRLRAADAASCEP